MHMSGSPPFGARPEHRADESADHSADVGTEYDPAPYADEARSHVVLPKVSSTCSNYFCLFECFTVSVNQLH